MRHIVMFSGGAGSWATARRVADREGTENLTLLFADTLMEDEDLYRFVEEAAANIGGRFVKIAEGRDVWQVFFDVRFLGNTRIDPCSRILKRELLRGWLEDNCDSADTTVYLGIDWSESHRFERAQGYWHPWVCEAPMCDPPLLDKADVIAALRAHGIAHRASTPKGSPTTTAAASASRKARPSSNYCCDGTRSAPLPRGPRAGASGVSRRRRGDPARQDRWAYPAADAARVSRAAEAQPGLFGSTDEWASVCVHGGGGVTYFRFDDALDGHPKQRRAGVGSVGIWCAAIIHSATPTSPTASSTKSRLRRSCQRPTSARRSSTGWWTSTCSRSPTGGYVVHDFHDCNPTRDKVLARRQARAEAGKRGGLATSKRQASAGANA